MIPGNHGARGCVTLLLGLLLLATVQEGSAFGTNRYAGYRVLRVHPPTPEMAQSLLSSLPSLGTHNVEVWRVRKRRATSMDISVSPADLQDLLELIEFLQIPHDTLVNDLRLALDDHASDVLGEEPEQRVFNIHRYNTMDNINNWLQNQAKKHPHMMELIQIGNSWEKRPIYVAKLQSPSSNGSKSHKPAIWLDAGIHSNEWIGPATLLFYIYEILMKYDKDESITELLHNYDVYILPVFNVDGYVYTWEEDRLWRKTRSYRNASTECAGVDMNRNWPFKWGVKPGVSTDPCSVIYGGPEAESEPEVRAVIRFLQDHRDVIKAYVAFHSYSQMWMMPFSYSSEKPKNHKELEDISRQVTAAIHNTNGKDYYYGTVIDLLGEASGSSVDYTYAILGVKYSFGIELRDDGLFGSLLPPSQIAPTALESLEGIKTLANLIKERI